MNSDDNHVLYYTNLIHYENTHIQIHNTLACTHSHTQNHNGDTAEAEENSVKIYSNVV